MANPWSQFTAMLIGQSPQLVVYVGGLILCLVMWSRHPRPALLAFLGCTMLLVATIGFSFAQVSMMAQRAGSGMSISQIGTMMSVVGLAAGVVRAAGFILLLCAVFAARQPQSLGAFPVGNPGNYPRPIPDQGR
jgi:hypothetical protein